MQYLIAEVLCLCVFEYYTKLNGNIDEFDIQTTVHTNLTKKVSKINEI